MALEAIDWEAFLVAGYPSGEVWGGGDSDPVVDVLTSFEVSFFLVE